MKKSSTLIYLINRFQKESNSSDSDGFTNEIFEKAESAEMAPSEQTINNILGFAKSYEVLETKTNGAVEMILN